MIGADTIPQLIIRADAGKSIGAGHLVRCLSLAQAWLSVGGDVDLITHCSTVSLLTHYRKLSINIKTLTQDEVLDVTWAAAYKNTSAWVVLDGYHFDVAYQQAISNLGLKILVIDDYNHLNAYAADVILNQNFSAEEYSYNTQKSTTYLLGTAYTLLRSEISTIAVTRLKTLRKRVVIAIGASDPENVTGYFLDSLATCDEQLEISVVAGALNPHIELLRAKIADSPHDAQLYIDLDAVPLFTLLRNADVAIVSGGGTAREAAHLGTPLLTVEVAENQQDNIKWLVLAGLAQNLGRWPLAIQDDVAAQLADVLANNDAKIWSEQVGAKLIVADGAQRVVRYLLSISNTTFVDTLSLREATAEDMLLYWVWSNQSHVRQYSLTSELIPLRDHIDWYEAALDNQNRKMWLLIKRNIPIGQVRYDKVSANIAQIGISVATTQRGHGYAVHLINETSGLAKRALGVSCIEAIVKNNNNASQKLFHKAGFKINAYKTISNIECASFYRQLTEEKEGCN